MSALYVSTAAARTLPVDLLLSSIPSLPRHVLDRLVERAIDRLDEIDGDTDLEPEEDVGAEEIGEAGSWAESAEGRHDTAPFADDEHEEDRAAVEMRQEHCERIQRTRCDEVRTPRGLLLRYRLKPPLVHGGHDRQQEERHA